MANPSSGAAGGRASRGLWAWLDERLGVSVLQQAARQKTVPIHRAMIWYYLGGMTLFFFIVQVCTGILLMLYYRPGADEAYAVALERWLALGGADLPERTEQVVADLGLAIGFGGAVLDRPVWSLSGGQAARASIAAVPSLDRTHAAKGSGDRRPRYRRRFDETRNHATPGAVRGSCRAAAAI